MLKDTTQCPLMRLKPGSPQSKVEHSSTWVHTYHRLQHTVKPVLSCHSKIDKTKVLMTNGSLMQIKSIAECFREHSAILVTCVKR